VHNNVEAYFEEGWKKKQKGFARIPFFFRTGNFLLVEGEQDCLYLDLTSYHEDVTARA